MTTDNLIEAAYRLQQGLMAKATDGEYPNEEYRKDLTILRSDAHLEKILPSIVKANRTADDFRRFMQGEYQHYKDRRTYIVEQMKPVFSYLEKVQNGRDEFVFSLAEDELGEPIGRGGYSVVYRYHHKLLDMDFAVKVFDPMFVSDEENVERERRFFREAKMLFSLNHESIVRVYDIGRINGKPYIKMELVEGENIQEFIDKHGPVSFERSIKPIKALLEGLSYAHKQGIIHRDLKPTNFMVKSNGEFRIIDFGISAFLDVGNHTQLTRTGDKVAGGAYTDPRLDADPKLRDFRSDIYSVGAIWYHILVGRAPQGGDVRQALIASGNVTELQCDIVMKCLYNDPANRYQSCDELLSVLFPSKESDAEIGYVSRNRITDITRDAIFEYLKNIKDEGEAYYLYNVPSADRHREKVFYYHGKKDELTFLSRLYNLKEMPSESEQSLEEEIRKHVIFNSDYPYEWIFEDTRFELSNGSDETLLNFLCQMFYPTIRSEQSDWKKILQRLNEMLKYDGYELYEKEVISGQSVYSYRSSI